MGEALLWVAERECRHLRSPEPTAEENGADADAYRFHALHAGDARR